MAAAKLNSIYTDPIPNGTKFVALFSDGSGADVYFKNDGLIFHFDYPEGEEAPDNQEWLAEAGYSEWIELPNDFKLWWERE